MEMALAKYPIMVYIIATRLSTVEFALGMLGAVIMILSSISLTDDFRAKEVEEDYARVALAIGVCMVIISLLTPSTDTALNIIAHSLIDPSEYGGNFEQYQYDLGVIKNFILYNY